MLKVRSSILKLFLLVLAILLNISLDAGHNGAWVFKVLLEKNFEFILSRKNAIIVLNLSLLLLLIEIDYISEKLGHEKDVLEVCNTNRVKIILI